MMVLAQHRRLNNAVALSPPKIGALSSPRAIRLLPQDGTAGRPQSRKTTICIAIPSCQPHCTVFQRSITHLTASL